MPLIDRIERALDNGVDIDVLNALRSHCCRAAISGCRP